MPLTPDSQLPKDRAELAAGRGEHVLVPGRARVVAAPFDEAGSLKFAQPRGQAGTGAPLLAWMSLKRAAGAGRGQLRSTG